MSPSPPDRPGDRAGDDSRWKDRAEAFFGGQMSEAERADFEREMAENPELAREVYTAMGMGPVFHEAIQALRIRQLESHARIADRTVSKHVPWWGRTRSRLAATIAVAAIAFVLVFVSRLGEPPPPGPDAEPVSTTGFRAISPAGEIAALPEQFTWSPLPTAAQYRFDIVDDNSQIVYTTITSATTLVVAVDHLAERGFRSGTWRVAALDRHGDELGETEPAAIRVVTR